MEQTTAAKTGDCLQHLSSVSLGEQAASARWGSSLEAGWGKEDRVGHCSAPCKEWTGTASFHQHALSSGKAPAKGCPQHGTSSWPWIV